LIVNRVRPHLVKKGKMLSVEDVNSILRLPLLGVIADEPDVITSTNKGQPVATDPASPVGASYRAIAAKLAGEDVPAPTVRIEGNGLLDRLGSFFGGRA
jgi:septum site-determining protein MinD